jgi:PAS domain S-box-containing protein
MKRRRFELWLYPNCFFVFFSLYLSVKFLFIFFFITAYEPSFLYHLTPFYLLSGVSNIQLLALSLFLIIIDLYLHLQSQKRTLLLSFFPTVLLLSGVTLTMMFSPIELSYLLEYILFGCLLGVILIDYHYVLRGIDSSRRPQTRKSLIRNIREERPNTVRAKSFFTRKQPQVPPVAPAVVKDNTVTELKKVSDEILQKLHIILDELERKSLRIEQLEHTSKETAERAINGTHALHHAIPSSESMNLNTPLKQNYTEEKILLKEKIENHLIVDDTSDIVAVVQRGIFREISNSFAGFLGYERTELLQKNFFVFIAPRGFEDAKKYYLNRLKGVASNSFRTILLSKTQKELLVDITVSPTIYKGDSAEFISIREVSNS